MTGKSVFKSLLSLGLKRDGLAAGRVFRIRYRRALRRYPTWSFLLTRKIKRLLKSVKMTAGLQLPCS